MKRTLLKSAMGLLLAGGALTAQAQLSNLVDAKFLVNSPSAIAGVKSTTNSGTNGWGRTIDSFWFNVPVARVHDPTSDSLGCGILNNGMPGYATLRGGKFALVFRGDCEFGTKAKKAQDSGAIGVIIVNNIPGAPVGMGAGADGANVTIPVLMVSQTDGQAMNAALQLGQPVNISISKWGFGFTNDLGIVGNSMPAPHAYAIPLSQMMAATGSTLPYRNYTGAFIANFGTAAQSNVLITNTVTFQPTSGSATQVNMDTLKDASFTVADSLKEYFSPRTFDLHPTSTGQYNFNYTVASSVTDNQSTDNSMSFSLNVTDSIFSKAKYNPATGNPNATGGYRFGGTLAGTVMSWGPFFYNVKGGYQAVKAAFAIGTENPTLGAEANTFVYMFRWRDLNSDNLITGNEMSLKGVGQKAYTATDSSYHINFASLRLPGVNKPVVTEDSAWYWIAVETNGTQYMGVDYDANYYSRAFSAKHASPSYTEYWAPQLEKTAAPQSGTTLPASSVFHVLPFNTTQTSIDSVGFLAQKGLVPSVALHLSKNPYVAAVGNAPTTFVNAEVFPNPASTSLTLNLSLTQLSKHVQFSIIDAVGKNMLHTITDDVRNAKFNFDLSTYPAGNYYLVIGTDQEVMAKPFTIAGR